METETERIEELKKKIGELENESNCYMMDSQERGRKMSAAFSELSDIAGTLEKTELNGEDIKLLSGRIENVANFLDE